jgi:hypothetical protein
MPKVDVVARRFYNPGTTTFTPLEFPAGTTQALLTWEVEPSTTRTFVYEDGQETLPAIGSAPLWDQPTPACEVVGEISIDGQVWQEFTHQSSFWWPLGGSNRIFPPFRFIRGRLTLASRERATVSIDYS